MAFSEMPVWLILIMNFQFSEILFRSEPEPGINVQCPKILALKPSAGTAVDFSQSHVINTTTTTTQLFTRAKKKLILESFKSTEIKTKTQKRSR